ncbi:MAG: hypothetical protein A3J09_02265 [Candidatus Zambryskibacteria bacterium RIFCSPLOWO2_02_FULL_51_21]|nr:MAG: hypothetical protein A2723_02265 [Candidatus Zambryskibacteria bacterium RIFCSPHIGHO2_01_FULL_52_18]OHB11358.1 MAG: hypothetical protein A3J09_02265 [Candidatus Zambryskibacteria bacterium RIFCSPLOWO2_02_FULL_51_21]
MKVIEELMAPEDWLQVPLVAVLEEGELQLEVPPEAVQVLAFDTAHESVPEEPEVKPFTGPSELLNLRLTVGGAGGGFCPATVTETESESEPPSPVQLMEKVVEESTAPEDWLQVPLVATFEDGEFQLDVPPEAVQVLAFDTTHESVPADPWGKPLTGPFEPLNWRSTVGAAGGGGGEGGGQLLL